MTTRALLWKLKREQPGLPRVYLKSRKYSLFLQTQRDFALESLEIHKGFRRLFALNPACVCEISVIFFVFRYPLKQKRQGACPAVFVR